MKKVCSILLVALALSSCLRFTPSRASLQEENVPLENRQFAGKEAFFKIEETQNTRLKALVQERLLGNTINGGDGSYRVGKEDVLEINVFDVEELNTTARVRPSGFISLPLLGAVRVAGLTEDEVQKELMKRLDKYVRSPQVHLMITEYGAHRVNVIGEVANPGTYSLKRDNYSLLEVLSQAGGRTEKASGRIVLIPSDQAVSGQVSGELNKEGKELNKEGKLNSARARLASLGDLHGVEIFFDDLVGSADKTPVQIPLLPGDTIVVPEAGSVQVDGEVRKPGSFKLSSRMSVIGAIAAAGGLTYSADVDAVEIIREVGNGQKALVSLNIQDIALDDQNKDVRLRDGDVVVVPSHTGRFATRQAIESLNRIFSFGLGGAL